MLCLFNECCPVYDKNRDNNKSCIYAPIDPGTRTRSNTVEHMHEDRCCLGEASAGAEMTKGVVTKGARTNIFTPVSNGEAARTLSSC